MQRRLIENPGMLSSFRTSFAGLPVLLVVVAGCGTAPQPVQESEPLAQLLSAYLQATDSLRRPPKDESELRPFLPADKADAMFISPRDGQPYVLRWGVNYKDPKLDPVNPPLIAYEQQGKDGIRHAVSVVGLAMLTEEQFVQLVK
jgi:hypothetical protein